MYYAQAMNRSLAERNDPAANAWADRVEQCFARDTVLMKEYNTDIAGGKWNGMMTQKHIGYFSWNDNFPADRLPRIQRIEDTAPGGFTFPADPRGFTAIEAEHWQEAVSIDGADWTVIPYMGRTLSGVALMPYTQATDGASLTYRVEIPEGVTAVKVHVITKSTLAFNNTGHRYSVEFGGASAVQRFNERLNEDPANIYSVYYPTVARRVVETITDLPASAGWQDLVLKPLDPGIVFEKVVIDYGGYTPQFLFGNESPAYRKSVTPSVQ